MFLCYGIEFKDLQSIMKIMQKQEKEMQGQIGNFSYEVTENNVRDYIKLVIDERDKLHNQWHKKRFDEDLQSKTQYSYSTILYLITYNLKSKTERNMRKEIIENLH